MNFEEFKKEHGEGFLYLLEQIEKHLELVDLEKAERQQKIEALKNIFSG